jgi:hypothetical protein
LNGIDTILDTNPHTAESTIQEIESSILGSLLPEVGMKRQSLKDPFQRQASNGGQGSFGRSAAETDQIILNVVGGAISFNAPGSVPDDEVTQSRYLEGFVNCTLQLENGAQILVWLSSGTGGVEVQVEAPRREKKRGKRRGHEPARVLWS